MTSERRVEYERDVLKQVKLCLNRNTNADLIEWLESKDNVQGYIKSLLYNEMEKEKRE